MSKRIGIVLLVATVAVGGSVLRAHGQGVCWDGSLVSNLKDCPRQPIEGGKVRSSGSATKRVLPTRRDKFGAGRKKYRQLQLVPPW